MTEKSSPPPHEEDRNATEFRKVLNDALKVFFKDAVRTSLRNPIQALHFFRTVLQVRGS